MMKFPTLIKDLRVKAGHLVMNTPLYRWSLGNGETAVKLGTVPLDPWTGDAEHGRWLCGGAFAIDGALLEKTDGNSNFEPKDVSAAWLSHMHGFSWLRDLRALGGDEARQQARALTSDWINRYGQWHERFWRADLTGTRIGNWIALYDFFAASADEEFQDKLLASLVRQARHLTRVLPNGVSGIAALQAYRGLALAGIAVEDHEAWLEQALDGIEREISKQILSDGGHVSRSPAQLFAAFQIMIEVRAGLVSGGWSVPPGLTHAIDRMAQAIRFFRTADKHFALFNGAQEGDAALIDAALAKANVHGKILSRLPESGYERLSLGRSLLIFDAGTASFPYDSSAHAAPLAFEFSYGKERIFVSCGSHPLEDDWRESLRGTAAHNALTLDHRNACEIGADGHIGRKPRKITVMREESDDAMLVEASHDGYVPLNGITHSRRLYLGEQGHDLRGEECLSCTVGLSRPVEVSLRFHLHPHVQVSLIRDGQEALLRLRGGAGWRFAFSGGAMRLENSVYLGEGTRPVKTKQIVLTGTMDSDSAVLKWALQRENAVKA